jgi:hypothetical protein
LIQKNNVKFDKSAGGRATSLSSSDPRMISHKQNVKQFSPVCIMKLLTMEELIWQMRDDMDANCMHRQLNCGGDCVWQASLVTSFGAWWKVGQNWASILMFSTVFR